MANDVVCRMAKTLPRRIHWCLARGPQGWLGGQLSFSLSCFHPIWRPEQRAKPGDRGKHLEIQQEAPMQIAIRWTHWKWDCSLSLFFTHSVTQSDKQSLGRDRQSLHLVLVSWGGRWLTAVVFKWTHSSLFTSFLFTPSLLIVKSHSTMSCICV